MPYKTKTALGIVTSGGNFLTPYNGVGATKWAVRSRPGSLALTPKSLSKKVGRQRSHHTPTILAGPLGRTGQTKSSSPELLFTGIPRGKLPRTAPIKS